MEPDAIVEILENPRYEGAMSTIQGVTDIVDGGFMAVITFLSFFIISVALLRNVFAGVYCAFPRFWDQVADAHKAQETKTMADLVAGVKDSYNKASMSTIKLGIMSILPNIKALTDFEDNTQTAKSYFIKAIPQMIVVVIIGVFIFNGYYRDATALVAGTGAELLERTLLSVDPVKVFDTITNTAGRPSFATDDAVTPLGQVKNDVSVKIYSEIISTYTDIKTAEDKAVLAANIDSAVAAIFGDNNGSGGADSTMSGLIMEDTKWKTTARVDMGKNFDPSNAASDSENVKMYCFKINLANTPSEGSHANIMFDSTSPEYANDWYIRVRVKLERQSVQADMSSSGAVINSMTIGQTKALAATYKVDATVQAAAEQTAEIEYVDDKNVTHTATLHWEYTSNLVDNKANRNVIFWVSFPENKQIIANQLFTLKSNVTLKGYDTVNRKVVNITLKGVKVSGNSDKAAGASTAYDTTAAYSVTSGTLNCTKNETPQGS